ncbi:MAG TPA: type II CAAX endopeptidase family protein [Acidobacteriaceae bacterium]
MDANPGSTQHIEGSDPVITPPPTPPLLHYILFGPEGLRAGWGIILFVAIYAAMERCLVPVRAVLLHAQPVKGGLLSFRQVLSLESAGILALIVATWLMARLERRTVADYGLAAQHRTHYFLRGLVWGVTLLSLLVFLLRAFGLVVFDARLLFGAATLHYGLLWLAGFLLVSLKEELFSRGYLQFTLTRGLRALYRWHFGPRHANALGFWTAAAALSYLFGVGHSGNPGESPLGLLSAGLAGFLFCLSLWRTGSLWWAIGFHASWDWAQSFLYGVPDSGLMARGHLFATHAIGRTWLSGGVTGPEGSILFLPVAFAGAGIVLLTLPRTHSGYLPVSDEEHAR